MTAADKYYLKAKDCYPYEIEEALEALDYGLSHDDTHAALLTLKGEIYLNDLKRFDAALECFALAVYHDPGYTELYYPYIRALCVTDDLRKAALMVAKAFRTKGIDKAKVWHLEALMLEQQGLYADAVVRLKNARNASQEMESYSFYGSEAKRVRKKSEPKGKREAETITE